MAKPNPMERAEMLWRKFRRTESGCWEWTAKRTADGYGKASGISAHRAVYQLLVEEVPPGMVLDHLCRNRACVNPSHLEVVTKAENNRRATAVRKLATHCKRGHEFTPDNTISKGGARACRTCVDRMERLRVRLRRFQRREERRAVLAAKNGEQLELWEGIQ